MTVLIDMPLPPADGGPAKPRIALMGEFSAGKSTLANFLFGAEVSPVQVTATQMPPILYTHGAPGVWRIDASGAETPMEDGPLSGAVGKGVRALRVSIEAEVLEFCDLIDMPGTSDPNLAMEVWEAMLSQVDGVIWCTQATQAWRQSEAALWEEVGDGYGSRSLLLITRMDKITGQHDRDRVLARVRREAGGLFHGVYPVSLTAALAARDDEAALATCGAADFVDAMMEMIADLANRMPTPTIPQGARPDAGPPP